MKRSGVEPACEHAPMSPAELRAHILRLSSSGPISLKLGADLSGGRPSRAWYQNQREHLLGWLGDYNGPGFYGRANANRTAAFVYSHFQCVEGLCWLAEAAGVPADVLKPACAAVIASGANNARRCAAFRRMVPWTMVDSRLSEAVSS